MEKEKIRVLQVHNLNIGPEDSALTALQSLLESRGMARAIDYLIVCGNLTRDLSAESFRNASKALTALEKRFLPLDNSRASRVVLVPGPQDVPDPDSEYPDFTSFRSFYESFFGRQFDELGAEVRDVKDLTLIGLTYWNSPDPEVMRTRVLRFGEAIDRAIGSKSSLEYTRTTPTLLISAGSPLFSSDGQLLSAHGNAQKAFNANLKLAFHLFAAGTQEYVAPVPFYCDHFSIGLGSDGQLGSRWPLRANLLEFDKESTPGRKPSPGAARLGRRIADVTFLRQRSSNEKWEERCSPVIVETESAPTPEPQFEELYFDFLNRLSLELFQSEHDIIHIQGFPGSGISEIYKKLTRERETVLAGSRVRTHGHFWENKEGFEKFTADLKVHFAQRADASRHLIVLYDPKLREIGREDKSNHVSAIKEALSAFLEPECRCKLLYITHFISFTLRLERCLPLSFGANGPIVNDLLVKSYISRVPLHARQVAKLVGGYIGFGRRLLFSCKHTFDGWPGARSIEDDRTPATLLKHAFDYSDVRSTCERFLDCVCSLVDGRRISDHVRKKVLAHYEQSAIDDLGQVEIDSSDVESPDWDKLTDYHIFERTETETSSRYRVRVVAPFLRRCSTTVFFSYHSEDREYVERIEELLKKKGEEEGSKVEIFAYSVNDWPREVETTLKDKVFEKLRRSRNLCVFLLRGRTYGKWVDEEVEVWNREWREASQKDCRCIPLVPQFNSEIPEFFKKGIDAVPTQGKDDETVVDELYNRLVWVEMRWGFEFKGLKAEYLFQQ